MATDPRFATFTPCPSPTPFDQPWLCATLDVRLDRSDPTAGPIPLAVYALAHTDASSPAREPLFATPGGPGSPGFQDYGMYALAGKLNDHHDIVTIDPRGTGHSGAIDCPGLQESTAPPGIVKDLLAACGQQLGTASDRYGAGDRAMDVEAVRAMLGYDTIDYYGGSYASLDVQAYAYRYPQHLRAVVVDAGFSPAVGGSDDGDFFGVGSPAAFIDVVALQCSRDTSCHRADPDPAATLTDLLQEVRAAPLAASAAAGSPVVDEAGLVTLIIAADPLELVAAADAARDGNPQPLLDVLSVTPGPADPAESFSAGDNAAANCNDYDAPWDRSDPIDVRRQKLEAAESALADDAFAPVSKQAWFADIPPDFCITWPTPRRYEPVVPAGMMTIDVPALLLSGDLDRTIPTFVTKELLHVFTKGTFVLVAGAGHPVLADSQSCAADLAARFLDTLDVGDTSCANDPG